jgi:hypothetical protein
MAGVYPNAYATMRRHIQADAGKQNEEYLKRSLKLFYCHRSEAALMRQLRSTEVQQYNIVQLAAFLLRKAIPWAGVTIMILLKVITISQIGKT